MGMPIFFTQERPGKNGEIFKIIKFRTMLNDKDSNGNFLWVKNGVNYYDDRGLGLCVDPVGNVYVTGTCWGGLDWGALSVYNSTSYTDQIFVVKFSGTANQMMAQK